MDDRIIHQDGRHKKKKKLGKDASYIKLYNIYSLIYDEITQ